MAEFDNSERQCCKVQLSGPHDYRCTSLSEVFTIYVHIVNIHQSEKNFKTAEVLAGDYRS